ncbi:type II toxin-antitoxin system VapC family toxin [Almyronema epifaneia]|uniref:Type II toxin-antitoxin system VapC family toxin n=1 Tax=Almyronema epifaneia S1 TaxID=2991925 RepID=A0ABW6IJJ1_9CYAN
MNNAVLDASAMLAYFYDEPGADVVEKVLLTNVCMGAINWAEVLSKVSDKGCVPQDLIKTLTSQGLLGNSLEILPTTEVDALIIAQLRARTRSLGLSLGDRACLALGLRLRCPVITADQIWSELDIEVSVQTIR